MSPPLFWVADVPRAGTDVVVSGPEGRHAVTVTRLAVGEELIACDGRGSTARCEIVAITGKDSLLARAHTYAVAAARHFSRPFSALPVHRATHRAACHGTISSAPASVARS
ncbi:MAG: RNA methyltransferase PUA domain-containing protein, partial [Actinomycetota bacterium]|nr:RNA methyltransferase PUA domain-containing protein [Actinomycetota bacterium]